MSDAQLADFSVATVWLARGERYYLLERMRGRYDFPQLKRAVDALRQRWPGAVTLIERAGSGISLIQTLRAEGALVIGRPPDADKQTRLFTTQPLFEAGAVLFPKNAPWIDELVSELLAFPQTRHDDQVDSIAHALNYFRAQVRQRQTNICIGLLVFLRKGI